jgi:ubiquinone/menaquinone biosynthesis C-methylase UbiE
MVKYDEAEARKTDRLYQTPDIARQRLRTLEALGLGAGERVLDVGCGTGLLAHDMATLVGPTGGVVGIDTSAAMLAFAARRCANLPQVEFKPEGAEDLSELEEGFDAVACTQVLLYVTDVAGAIAQMHRVLKPGGRLVVIETDWRGTVLNSFDDAMTRRILAAWDNAVSSPNLPVLLSPLLRAQGFSVSRVEAIPIVNTSRTQGNFSPGMLEQLARYAQKRSAVSDAETQAWLDDLEAKGEAGAYFFCVNRFLFTAVKR